MANPTHDGGPLKSLPGPPQSGPPLNIRPASTGGAFPQLRNGTLFRPLRGNALPVPFLDQSAAFSLVGEIVDIDEDTCSIAAPVDPYTLFSPLFAPAPAGVPGATPSLLAPTPMLPRGINATAPFAGPPAGGEAEPPPLANLPPARPFVQLPGNNYAATVAALASMVAGGAVNLTQLPAGAVNVGYLESLCGDDSRSFNPIWLLLIVPAGVLAACCLGLGVAGIARRRLAGRRGP